MHTRLWREAHVEVNSVKKETVSNHLEVEMMKRCTQLWHAALQAVAARSTCRVERFQTDAARALLDIQLFRCRVVWQAQGILQLAKNQQRREGFVACPKAWQAWDA